MKATRKNTNVKIGSRYPYYKSLKRLTNESHLKFEKGDLFVDLIRRQTIALVRNEPDNTGLFCDENGLYFQFWENIAIYPPKKRRTAPLKPFPNTARHSERVGTEYRLQEDHCEWRKGDVLVLSGNDYSSCPLFHKKGNNNFSHYVSWCRLAPL